MDDDYLKFMTLGQALDSINTVPWDSFIYVPQDSELCRESLIAFIRDESSTYGSDPHPIEKTHKLRYLLNTADVQSIVANAYLQIAAPTSEQLLEAFKYYVEYDAFIDLIRS